MESYWNDIMHVYNNHIIYYFIEQCWISLEYYTVVALVQQLSISINSCMLFLPAPSCCVIRVAEDADGADKFGGEEYHEEQEEDADQW